MLKLKNGLLVSTLMLAFSGAAFSQVKPAQPTEPVAKTDTTILEDVKEGLQDNIPVVSLDENDGQDGSAQNISSQLNAGRDPFMSAATFKFSAVRFRIRGYDADLFSTYMNGVPMENLDNGFTPFGLWGGLNDVLRNRDNVTSLRPSSYSFGDLGGLTNFDTRASHQRKQTSFNYAISNRNYVHRIMVTHSTGLNKKGWAFTFAGSRRWAEEGFTDGTFYNGWSGFFGVDKRVNDRHLLSLVAIYSPTESGRQGSSVQEMVDIAGTNFYNPYWGYQNGKKRNYSVAKTNQPIFILSHDWKVNDRTTILTGASYIFGKRSVSGLDWYNSADPRPDYYRYLPSYQEDPVLAQAVLDGLRSDVNKRQVNWDRMYQVNAGNFEVINNVNGIPGNTVSGKRSLYIVEDRITATNRFTFNSTINTMVGSNVDVTGGVSYQNQTNKSYKEVEDLLGGQFYMDINQFAERDFGSDPNAAQNDLNNPNRVIYKGDKFGYNYNINIQKVSTWFQAVAKFRKIDMFIASEHSYTSFFRRGKVRSGLFPDNSYGKSSVHNFYNSSFKGGLTYKINGRNYVYANATYMSRAPFFENAYIAPRTRDFVQDNLASEEIGSVEGGYVLNSPKVKAKINGYYTHFKNQLNVITFYNDAERNFVNYAISNIGKQHAGVEMGIEAKVYKGLSLNAAASIGRYYFDNNQNATVTQDNSAALLSKDVVYAKNLRVATPQEAYTFGFDYRSPKFWFFDANINFFDQMFLDFNPLRRTDLAVSGVDPGSQLWNDILGQTKLKSQYTVDIFAGYSMKLNGKYIKGLKKNTFLVFNAGINNLLDNRNIVSGGFEQLRFDFAEKNVNKFPTRKFYAYGINFFASVGLRF